MKRPMAYLMRPRSAVAFLVRTAHSLVSPILKRLTPTQSANDAISEELLTSDLHHFGHPEVGVIILVKDNYHLTKNCLTSLLEETTYPNFNLTIIDNASGPKTKNLLSKWQESQHPIQVTTNKKNLSFSAANNRAVKQIQSQLLLFLNNDTLITEPDWLDILVQELLLRPNTAAVGPRLLFNDRKNIQSAGIRMEFNPETNSFVQAAEIRDPLPSRYVGGLTAACLLLRRDAFLAAGGFDERYIYGQEDVDLCLSLRNLGFDLFHTSKTNVVHLEAKTRAFGKTTERNRRLIRKKWQGKTARIKLLL